jgi:hypothetical protein
MLGEMRDLKRGQLSPPKTCKSDQSEHMLQAEFRKNREAA